MSAQRLRVSLPFLVALLLIPGVAGAEDDAGIPDPAATAKSEIRLGGGGLADNGCECRSAGPRGGTSSAVGVGLALAATFFARRRRLD